MFSGKITTPPPPSPNVPVHLCLSPKRGFTPTKSSNALLLLVVHCIKWNLTINCCGARHLIPLHHPQWKRSLHYQWLFYCQFPEVSIWIMHGWKVEIIKIIFILKLAHAFGLLHKNTIIQVITAYKYILRRILFRRLEKEEGECTALVSFTSLKLGNKYSRSVQ